MLKDITIDNRLNRVFVLLESDERIVYIPIKGHIALVDFNRLSEMANKAAGTRSMLDEMKRTTLDNGINALKLYENIIQVLIKSPVNQKAGQRLPKPSEAMIRIQTQPNPQPAIHVAPVVVSQPVQSPQPPTAQYRIVDKDGVEHFWSGYGNAKKVFRDYFASGGSKEDLRIK